MKTDTKFKFENKNECPSFQDFISPHIHKTDEFHVFNTSKEGYEMRVCDMQILREKDESKERMEKFRSEYYENKIMYYDPDYREKYLAALESS